MSLASQDQPTVPPALEMMTDETMVNLPTPFADDLIDSSFWPFSTSWQWQHEGQYLSGPTSLYGDDQAMLTDIQFNQDGWYNNPDVPAGSHLEDNVGAGTAGNPGVTTPLPVSMKAMIHDMVESAMNTASGTVDWNSYSKKISCFTSEQDAPHRDLDRGPFDGFVKQYFDHFHPLWAMVAEEPDLETRIQPLLYLCITSIGALYSTSRAAVNYGSILHNKLRDVLIHYSFPPEQTEAEALDTGRAMLLTQVAALYFEQNGAFSTAQRLSATLCAHSHRMRLFTTKEIRNPRTYTATEDYQKDTLLLEGRKMLAFGMLRAEAFMSVLFNRKPSISYEEIDLALPDASDLTDVLDSERTRGGSRSRRSHSNQLFFSDLVRILLEEDEILPVLGPADAEALIFGLQHEVWRFSHDPKVFLRLMKRRRPSHDRPAKRVDMFDHLDCSSRKMRLLVGDYERLVQALHRWKQTMSQIQISNPLSTNNRTTYLSGLVLYDLSFLRLTAPLETIQQMAYQLHSPPTSDRELIQEVRDWTSTPEAAEAVQHARSIWVRLNLEAQRPSELQARYIILMLIALHHAAVVIWAVAGADVQPQQRLVDDCAETALKRINTKALMLKFEELFPKITASWGIKSSFAKMVRDLAEYPLLYSYDEGPQTLAE